MKDLGTKRQAHFKGYLKDILQEIEAFTSNPSVVDIQPFQIYCNSSGMWIADIYYKEA
ncbi:MAG: hypothetical protein WBP82_12090 [Leuconostoc mesenteroides]